MLTQTFTRLAAALTKSCCFLIVADSTYSDATGAGCWGRLLVQNMGWDLSATISWYLIGSFARGMDYDSDGILRAEWPNSGHFELTP